MPVLLNRTAKIAPSCPVSVHSSVLGRFSVGCGCTVGMPVIAACQPHHPAFPVSKLPEVRLQPSNLVIYSNCEQSRPCADMIGGLHLTYGFFGDFARKCWYP